MILSDQIRIQKNHVFLSNSYLSTKIEIYYYSFYSVAEFEQAIFILQV